MEKSFEQVIPLLDSLRLRAFFNTVIQRYSISLGAGAVVSLTLSFLALFFPFKFDAWTIFQIIILALTMSTALCATALPDHHETLALAQSLECNTQVPQMFKSALGMYDAINDKSLTTIPGEFRQDYQHENLWLYPIKIPFKKLAIYFLIFAMAFGLSFIETDAKVKVFKMEKIKGSVVEGLKTLNHVINEVNLSSRLDTDPKKELGKIVDNIGQNIQKARTPADIKRALVSGEDELDKLEAKVSKDEFSIFAQRLKRNLVNVQELVDLSI